MPPSGPSPTVPADVRGGRPVEGGAELARVRADLPLVDTCHYFNVGRYGPIPRLVHEALVREAVRELQAGRGTAPAHKVEDGVAEVRRRLEALLGAPAGSVALTHNASEGINAALTSLRWSEGDEVITLTTEHPSALAPLEVLAMRHGVTIRRLEPETAPEAIVDDVVAAVGERTRA